MPTIRRSTVTFSEHLQRGIALPHYDGLKMGRPAKAALTRLWTKQRPDVVRIATDGIFWYALMLALVAWQGQGALPAVLHMIVAGLAGTLIYKWLKGATERPRPDQAYPTICCLTAPLDRFSFPSGHTLHAVVFSLVATAYYPALGWLVWPFTALVALSRLVLGLHYVSDVLVGALLGGAVAALALAW